MPGFKGFMEHFKKNIPKYQELSDALNPQDWVFPPEADKICNLMRKLIILRCIRPDKLVPAFTKFVVETLGVEFTNPPPFELPAIFKDSNSTTPLIFILSPGADPLNGLMKFAE